MQENCLQLLAPAASILGVPLREKQLRLFTIYHREIMAWNSKINLLSRSSAEDTLLKNFLDSLAVAQFITHKESTVLDMGSGGGFPGIPLKIAVETLKISLLDASRKKSSFLNHVIRKLQLSGITVLHDRAENLQQREPYRNGFDVVVSQATFKLPQLLSLGASFLSRDGVLIALKGTNIREELEDAKLAAATAGLTLLATHPLTLPVTGDQHLILIYKRHHN